MNTGRLVAQAYRWGLRETCGFFLVRAQGRRSRQNQAWPCATVLGEREAAESYRPAAPPSG